MSIRLFYTSYQKDDIQALAQLLAVDERTAVYKAVRRYLGELEHDEARTIHRPHQDHNLRHQQPR